METRMSPPAAPVLLFPVLIYCAKVRSMLHITVRKIPGGGCEVVRLREKYLNNVVAETCPILSSNGCMIGADISLPPLLTRATTLSPSQCVVSGSGAAKHEFGDRRDRRVPPLCSTGLSALVLCFVGRHARIIRSRGKRCSNPGCECSWVDRSGYYGMTPRT